MQQLNCQKCDLEEGFHHPIVLYHFSCCTPETLKEESLTFGQLITVREAFLYMFTHPHELKNLSVVSFTLYL